MARDALALAAIDAFYGDSHVLHGVSLRLGQGRLLGLLGRNGAGKTTCMSVTVGLLPPRRGGVAVFGADVTGRAPEDIAAAGVALVPQGRRIFRSLTVRRISSSPRARRIGVRRMRPGRSRGSMPPFRSSASGSSRSQDIFPAASSRCSPSAARSWRIRASS